MNVFNSVFNPSAHREGSVPVSGGGVRCVSVAMFESGQSEES